MCLYDYQSNKNDKTILTIGNFAISYINQMIKENSADDKCAELFLDKSSVELKEFEPDAHVEIYR